MPRLAATVRGQLSAHQAEKLGLGPRPVRLPLPAIIDEAFDDDYDVILLSLDGSRTPPVPAPLRQAGETGGNPPPSPHRHRLPWIVFRMHLNGFMDRAPVDLFCMTSKVDHALYTTAVGALDADPSNAIVTGLSITWRMGKPSLTILQLPGRHRLLRPADRSREPSPSAPSSSTN